jgi:hypothetical protein
MRNGAIFNLGLNTIKINDEILWTIEINDRTCVFVYSFVTAKVGFAILSSFFAAGQQLIRLSFRKLVVKPEKCRFNISHVTIALDATVLGRCTRTLQPF